VTSPEEFSLQHYSIFLKLLTKLVDKYIISRVIYIQIFIIFQER